MDFRPNSSPVEAIKKVLLVVLILEIFFLELMISGIKIAGKNLKNWKVLMVDIIVLILMMSV